MKISATFQDQWKRVLRRLAVVERNVAAPPRVPAQPRIILVENLDDYKTSGRFIQPSNVNAQAGQNYPVDQAGLLTVFALPDESQVYQTYQSYKNGGNDFFWRGFYNVGGGWGPWERATKGTIVDCGQESVTPSGGMGKLDVTFRETFTSTPSITVSAWSGVDAVQEVQYQNATTTGFQIVLRRTTNASTTVSWQAIQKL